MLLFPRAYRDIGIAAKRTFLHVAVGDIEVANECVNLSHIGDRLFRGTQVRLRDDLEQRCARTVEIDAGSVGKALMDRFAGIFFQMCPRNADALFSATVDRNDQLTVLDDRQLVLADLVTLRQIGIEVVLAREYGSPCDICIHSKAKFAGHADGFLVKYGQYARITEVDQAGLRVRLGSIRRRSPGKYLAPGRKLGVDFKADHDFPGAAHW